MSYQAKIDVILSGLRELAKLEDRLDEIDFKVKRLKTQPIDLNVKGAGELRDLSGVLSKNVNDLVRNFNNFGKSFASVSAQASVFGDFINQTALRGQGAYKQQDTAVRNLADAYTTATAKAKQFELQQINLIRTSQGYQTQIQREIQTIERRTKVQRLRAAKASPAARLGLGAADVLSGFGMTGAARGLRKASLGKSRGVFGGFGAAIPSAIISGAFPILTGQGTEAGIGGAIGGLAGGALGALFGPAGVQMGSFAGGLVGSIIGERIGEAKRLTEQLKKQQDVIRVINGLEEKRSDLTIAVATAQQQGNKALATELERRQKNTEIAQKLFETLTKLEADERNKTKEGKAIVELEKQRAYQVANRAVNENNALSALQQQKIVMEKQIKLSDRQNESVQRRLQTTSKLIGFAGETIAAGGSAAQAIGTARVSELERIAARTQNPLEQANLQAAAAKEIASAAERAYQIRLLDIELSQMQLKIEHKIQQSKLAQVVAQAKIAKANKMDAEALSAYEDAIEAQRSAVDVSQAAVLAGEAKAQFARSQAAAEYSQKLQGVVERLDKARDLANSVGGEASKAARGIQDIAVYTARASAAALNLAESWFRAGSAISGAMQKMAGAAAVRAGVMKAPAPVAPTSRGYAEVNGVRTYFAEGGFVTRPTNAMVGEGGQPEYVIPASKMNDAMRRYSAGTRGEAVVNGAGASGGMSSTTNYSNQQNAYYGSGGGTSVNITTGPVMRLGNKNYVTVSDMQRGMAAAVGAAEANMMSRMSRSYAARRSMGL